MSLKETLRNHGGKCHAKTTRKQIGDEVDNWDREKRWEFICEVWLVSNFFNNKQLKSHSNKIHNGRNYKIKVRNFEKPDWSQWPKFQQSKVNK